VGQVADFDPLHLHLAPPQGFTPVEFRGDLWRQKTRVPGLSNRCIVLLYFAIRLESRKSANKRIYLSIYQFCCLVNRGTMGVSSLPKTVRYPTASRLRSEPGPSAPESSTLTTRLPSHPGDVMVGNITFLMIFPVFDPSPLTQCSFF